MVAANVVRDFHIGNTRIRIADNYCKKTASEVEWLLQRIAQQAQRQFNAAAAAGIYEQEEDTEIPEMPAERALIRLQNSVYEMEEVTKQLSLIMEDGEVTAGEWTTLEEVQKKLLEFRRRADENLAVLEKAARLGKFD